MSFRSLPSIATVLAVCCTAALPARAVIFSTGSATFNISAPTGNYVNSGWQYEGEWGAYLGTTIAPNYFITASHINDVAPDAPFKFGGHDYVIDQWIPIAGSDLRIAHVTEAFATYAPLYTGSNETGKELVVIGRGTQRGADVPGKGWLWGTADQVKRWGTNQVVGIANGGANGDLLAATFNHNAGANEAMLSLGDSGGAVFIKDTDDVWKLAGINYGVSGPYYTSASGTGEFNAALYDESGYYEQTGPTTFSPASGAGAFFASRISSRALAISQIIPEPGAASMLLLGLAMTAMRRRRR